MVSRREVAVGAAAAAMLSAAAEVARRPLTASGTTRRLTVRSANVPAEVGVMVYTPASDGVAHREALPLMLLLHGGNGSDHDLLRLVGAIDGAVRTRRIPPMIVATPSAGRSLYMDFKDGSQRWETFIVADLLPMLRRELRLSAERHLTFVGGISMGGLGSLRLAFKHPDIFGAVAALEPAIEPALAWRDVGPRVKFWRSDPVLAPMFGAPVDEGYWAANNPATIAQRDPSRLFDLPIYLDVGDQDMLYLTQGVEFLHRILFDAGVGHEYRLVRGADHVGPSLPSRVVDALDFIGRQVVPPGWIDEEVLRVRASFDDMKRARGLLDREVDPRRIHGMY